MTKTGFTLTVQKRQNSLGKICVTERSQDRNKGDRWSSVVYKALTNLYVLSFSAVFAKCNATYDTDISSLLNCNDFPESENQDVCSRDPFPSQRNYYLFNKMPSKTAADDILFLYYLFLFLGENKAWHFMWIVLLCKQFILNVKSYFLIWIEMNISKCLLLQLQMALPVLQGAHPLCIQFL